METEGSFRLAEHHYLEGLDFKAAINMYCASNMFEDAYRVIYRKISTYRLQKIMEVQTHQNKLPTYGQDHSEVSLR